MDIPQIGSTTITCSTEVSMIHTTLIPFNVSHMTSHHPGPALRRELVFAANVVPSTWDSRSSGRLPLLLGQTS